VVGLVLWLRVAVRTSHPDTPPRPALLKCLAALEGLTALPHALIHRGPATLQKSCGLHKGQKRKHMHVLFFKSSASRDVEEPTSSSPTSVETIFICTSLMKFVTSARLVLGTRLLLVQGFSERLLSLALRLASPTLQDAGGLLKVLGAYELAANLSRSSWASPSCRTAARRPLACHASHLSSHKPPRSTPQGNSS